jgi:hypothetical protein
MEACIGVQRLAACMHICWCLIKCTDQYRLVKVPIHQKLAFVFTYVYILMFNSIFILY